MTTHYIIFIKDHDLKLKASYRGGTFFRIERTSGKMTDLILDKFGIIVPLKETEIKTYRQRYEKHITYTAIESKKSFYTHFTDAWFRFYENYKEIPPKFATKDGQALKRIIVYLKKVSGSEEEALELWRVILGSWKYLDEFHQKNTDLTYIEGQINKIISNVKRFSKTGTNGVSDDYLKSVIDDLRT
jgi:hypothetical protein